MVCLLWVHYQHVFFLYTSLYKTWPIDHQVEWIWSRGIIAHQSMEYWIEKKKIPIFNHRWHILSSSFHSWLELIGAWYNNRVTVIMDNKMMMEPLSITKLLRTKRRYHWVNRVTVKWAGSRNWNQLWACKHKLQRRGSTSLGAAT